VPRSAVSGEGAQVAVVLCTECGSDSDERWAVIERWTWWSDGYGNLLPFCPHCAERQFGHRVRRDPMHASPEMTRGSCEVRLDDQQARVGVQASVEGAR
jgi:hypothetical protein